MADQTVIDAARAYIKARDYQRSVYVRTARNAPTDQQVAASKAAAVRNAEDRLREALEEHDQEVER